MKPLLALLAVASVLVAIAMLAYVRRPAPEPELPVTWTRTNATGLNAGPWEWTAA